MFSQDVTEVYSISLTYLEYYICVTYLLFMPLVGTYEAISCLCMNYSISAKKSSRGDQRRTNSKRVLIKTTSRGSLAAVLVAQEYFYFC